MRQKLKIERVIAENFTDFVSLIDKMAKYEKHNSLDNQAKVRLKKDALSKNPKFEAFLVRINKEFIGYIIFYMTYSSYLALPTLHIEDIFILENLRRRGIGQKMFQFCIEQACTRGCGRMEWTVYDWNESAINFYKKFKAIRLNKTYYRLNMEQIEKFNN